MASTRTKQLRLGDHYCVLIEGDDARMDAFAQVASAGASAGEAVVVITAAVPPDTVDARLRLLGGAVAAGLSSGQVKVIPAEGLYVVSGLFDANRVFDTMAGHAAAARAAGHRGLWLIGDMTWTTADPTGVDEVARYEAIVNRLLLDGQAFGACLYDPRHLDTDLMRRVTCAHPATTRGLGAGHPPLLRLRRTWDPYGLQLVGEVDVSNRRALLVALDAVATGLPHGTPSIVLDVTALRFADAGGARALGVLADRVHAQVTIVGCRGAVAVVLDRLGIAARPDITTSP